MVRRCLLICLLQSGLLLVESSKRLVPLNPAIVHHSQLSHFLTGVLSKEPVAGLVAGDRDPPSVGLLKESELS